MTSFPRAFTVSILSLALLGSACASFDGSRAEEPVVQPTPSPPKPTPPMPSPEGFVVGPQDDGGLAAEVEGGVDGPQPDELPGPGAWTVRSITPILDIWADPGQAATVRFALETTNPWGQQVAYPIVRALQTEDGAVWHQILLGIEPNGSRGWVRASDVTVGRADERIVVDMSTRTLRHRRDGTLIHRFLIGIGAPGTPTTPGRFFVWARLQPSDTDGQYGSYLLGLSGFSEVLKDWPGGGRMAIHGTPDASDRGGEVSFGCIRVFNEQMDRLRDVPMGTMVVLRP